MSIQLTEAKVTMVTRQVEHHQLVMEIRDAILAYGPEHFNMMTWWDGTDAGNDLNAIIQRDVKAINACGTTGCLAGHTAAYANGHGLKDLITYSGNYSRPEVDTAAIARLLGVSMDDFSSGYHNWHPVALAAYKCDVARQLHDRPVTFTVSEWDDDESDYIDVPRTATTHVDLEAIGGESDVSNLVVDGNTGLASYEVYNDFRRHAEWVAMTTYLTYVAMLSESLHYQNSNGISDRDQATIMASPAFGVGGY